MVNVSVEEVIGIFIGIVLIIGGVFLLVEISKVKEIISEFPLPSGDVEVNVFPENGKAGTVFFMKAILSGIKEEQDLSLLVQSKNYNGKVKLYDDGKHFDKKPHDGIYGGFFDSFGKPLGIYEIKTEKGGERLANFSISNEECEVIAGDGNDDDINFLILPQGFKDFEDFKKTAVDLIGGIDSFLRVEPYKSLRKNISFEVLDTSRDLGCKIGCKGVPTIVCCNDKAVYEEASKCHYDSLIILLNSDKYCGSASSYAKICAKNKDANLILLHETGHSFADFADEYVYDESYPDYNIGEIDSINCAEAGCEKWKSITRGCYKGCTYSNLYRPAKVKSIMYKLVPVFNEVCKKALIDLIHKHVIKEKNTERLLPTHKSYSAEFFYESGNLELEGVSLKPVKFNLNLKKSPYTIRLIDSRNQKIFESSLEIPTLVLPLPGTSVKPVMKNRVIFSVLLPYFPTADRLEVYEKNKEKPIIEASLKVFSEKCGDGICGESENHASCPKDCKEVKDNFCESLKCDPDCKSKKGCEKEIKIKFYISILLILIGLLCLGFILRRIYKS